MESATRGIGSVGSARRGLGAPGPDPAPNAKRIVRLKKRTRPSWSRKQRLPWPSKIGGTFVKRLEKHYATEQQNLGPPRQAARDADRPRLHAGRGRQRRG